MVKLKKFVTMFKEKKGNTGLYIGLGALAITGLYMGGAFDNVSVQNPIATQSVSDTSSSGVPDFYISSLVVGNTTVYSKTTSGSGNKQSFLLEADKDVMGNLARIDTFTIGFTQDVAGTSSKSTIENYPTIYVPFNSDVTLKDTSDISHVLFQKSGSTIAGSKDSFVLTLQGATEVTKTLSLSVNPNGADLTTLAEINDVGEFKLIDLDFGQINSVQVKIKN